MGFFDKIRRFRAARIWVQGPSKNLTQPVHYISLSFLCAKLDSSVFLSMSTNFASPYVS